MGAFRPDVKAHQREDRWNGTTETEARGLGR